jgi:hypothetical protein
LFFITPQKIIFIIINFWNRFKFEKSGTSIFFCGSDILSFIDNSCNIIISCIYGTKRYLLDSTNKSDVHLLYLFWIYSLDKTECV